MNSGEPVGWASRVAWLTWPEPGADAAALMLVVLAIAVALRGMWGWRGARDGRAFALLLGAAASYVVLTGPVEVWSTYLLWVHMVQHVVLTFVAAPLLVAAAPLLPFWRGLPRTWQRFLQPFVVHGWVRSAGRVLLHPVTALIAYTLSTWVWHSPALYALAAQDEVWHVVEHLSFLVGSALLWVQVLEPTPLRSAWSPLARVGIVLAADLQNTAFCALLAFRGESLYPLYEASAAAAGMPALEDQRLAAGIMWVASQVTLLPAAGLLLRAAFRAGVPKARRTPHACTGWLATRLPIMAWLSRPRVRGVARGIVACLSVAVILDGFRGPADAAANLAGTWTWNVWRGAAIFAIVAVGNVPCVICPFMAPRGLLRRFVRPRLEWPRGLRRKWIAVALLVAWLIAAEWGMWWNSPVATALVIVGYFASILVVDAIFKGSSFCAWICPLGQYQQAAALTAIQPTRPGMAAQGRVALTVAGEALPPRLDRGVLWMVVTAAGFSTALLMTAPAVGWLERFAGGGRSPGAVVALAMIGGLVVVPVVLGSLATGLDPASFERRFTLGWRALLPLGVAMWVAHLGFHLVTGWPAAWGALERFVGVTPLASTAAGPSAGVAIHHASVDWLVPLQLIVVQVGVWGAIGGVRRTIRQGGWGWIALALLLGAAGCWIALQPMAMRGVMP